MTKKQMGLIFTLMALLVCVAVLSLKLNETGLNDPAGLTALISNDDKEVTDDEAKDKTQDKDAQKDSNTTNEEVNKENETETSTTQSSLITLRSSSEKNDATTIQNLESIINSSSSSQEQIERATEELSLKNKMIEQQGRIETSIKLLGYSDALCLLDNGKAKVYIKTDETLTDEKVAAINEAVEDVASDLVSIKVNIAK